MAFAIYYSPTDLLLIANQLRRQDYSQAIKDEADRYWDAGYRHYLHVPYAPIDKMEDENVREVVMSTGQGASGIQGFADLLRAMSQEKSTDPLALYMGTIADDLESGGIGANSSGVEPWNSP